jgi:hypothetical protein
MASDQQKIESGPRPTVFPLKPIPLWRFLVDARVESYSTVTDLARLRGWSTSVPICTAV